MYDKEHPLINKVKEQFADGRMGRRDFLRYSTLLGMSAMAAYAFVGKVTGIDYVPQAGAASMPVGGTMRVAQRVAEVSDAHALSWFFWSNKVFPVCQTLSRTGADNITRPLLAKGFSANEDLTSWTIHLRPEAKWTSGRPFIADDVIANLEHLLDPDTGSSAVGLMAYLMKDVEKDGETTKMIWDANALEKVDDFTLRMNIQVPQVAIPEHFFHYTNTMLDPEEGWSYRPGANGTGPMELAELTPRGKCVFTKKKDHWGQPAYVDRFEFVDIGEDPAAVFAALASKQVHGIFDLGEDQIDAAKGIAHAKIYSTATGECPTLSLRTDFEPWGDNRVRRALKKAINVKHLTLASLGEAGSPGEHHHVSPIHPEYVALPEYEQNIEEAKQLLAEAGFKNGLETDVTMLGTPEYMAKLGQAFKDQLGKAGVTLNLKPVTMEAFWGLWDKDVVTLTNWAHRPLAIQIMALVYRTGVPWNTFRWGSDELDEALTKAEGTVDVEERKKYVKIIEDVLQSEGPMLQPSWVNLQAAYDKRVKGFAMHPSGSIFPEELAIES